VLLCAARAFLCGEGDAAADDGKMPYPAAGDNESQSAETGERSDSANGDAKSQSADNSARSDSAKDGEKSKSAADDGDTKPNSADGKKRNRAGAEDKKPHPEFTIVPFLGGDSDVGLGGGFISSLARIDPRYDPYLYRIESTAALTFKDGSEGFEVPYTDAYVLLDMPHLIRNRLRVKLRVSYTREKTLKYYGLGNQSVELDERDDRYYEFERVHPTLQGSAEYRLASKFLLTWGLGYTQNALQVPSGTKLAEDMHSDNAAVRDLLGRPQSHGVMLFSYGIGWDSRDDQVTTTRGQYHTLRIDLAPGGSSGLPYRWGRADLSLRVYVPLVPERIVFAGRLLSDLVFGDVPFYELPRYDDTSALGGVKGVRGIPAQRYWGRVKFLSNLELRTRLFDFELFHKKNAFGLTGFVDTGRVFTDYHSHPELDGTSLGLKVGVGGGIRISAGSSFVLRLDCAWAREAHPVSAYLAGGEAF
jgi:hypothetical protein